MADYAVEKSKKVLDGGAYKAAAEIKLDDFAAPDDNTDLNASTSAHGLLPKLSGDSNAFLDGSGAFDTLAVEDLPSMTSADLAGKLTDETGSGAAVFATEPEMTGPVVDMIQFDTLATPALALGAMRWNATENCVEFGEPNGGSLQVGHEERLYAKNREAVAITDGQVVYVYDAAGGNVEVKLADADDYSQAVRTIAMATEDIPANENGRFTMFGMVRGVDTSVWAEGTEIYLSQTPGALTSTPPAYPAHKIRVGIVTRQSATVGEIFVNIRVVWRKFGDVTGGNYSGFEDDGTLMMHGEATAFDDVANQLIGQKLESPASDITQNDAEGSVDFDDACTLADYVVINVQMPHKSKFGAAIFPHVHWWQNASAVPNWLIQYRWQAQGVAKTTTWTSLVLASNEATYTSGILNQITGTVAGITPPVGAGLSDIVQFRLIRDTANASGLFAGVDPYTGDAQAVNFDIHVEIDSFGSHEEYVK